MATSKKKKPAKKQLAKKAPAKKAAPKKASAKKAQAPAKKIVSKPASANLKVQDFFTPLDDRLIVAVAVEPETTAGGLYIPNSGEARPTRGEVLARGRGRRNKKGQLRPLDVEVGDQILFAEYAGTKITISGDELLILREDEVLGIVT